MTKLTISEALAEGYTLCGYSGRDYQSLMNVADMTKADFEQSEGKIVLAEKEPMHHKIGPDALIEFAVEDYFNNDEFSIDDTNDMEDLMKKNKSMFDEFAEKLNVIYREKDFYRITDIELIPNDEEN